MRSITELVAAATLAALLGGVFHAEAATAQQRDTVIDPQIGLKSEEVLLNDLRQMGLPDAEILDLGETARIRVRVEAGTALLDVDRTTGMIEIEQAEPEVRRALEQRVPNVHLRRSPELREDCVSFDPADVRTDRRDGRWKIVSGRRFLFDFADARDEAQQALAVIRHYRANESCFVGRPDPSLSYLLSQGTAPEGKMKGEDCIAFDPSRIQVTEAQGRWKIAEGDHWILDFGQKPDEAREALAVIQKHDFRHVCYVGRPDPSFTYLRR